MDQVGQKRDAAGRGEQHDLHDGGEGQHAQADEYRSQTGAGTCRLILMVVVMMRMEELAESPFRMRVVMRVLMRMGMCVGILMRVWMGVFVAQVRSFHRRRTLSHASIDGRMPRSSCVTDGVFRNHVS